jgi:hypothetical protein
LLRAKHFEQQHIGAGGGAEQLGTWHDPVEDSGAMEIG